MSVGVIGTRVFENVGPVSPLTSAKGYTEEERLSAEAKRSISFIIHEKSTTYHRRIFLSFPPEVRLVKPLESFSKSPHLDP